MSNNKYSVDYKIKAIEMYLSGKHGGLEKICQFLKIKSSKTLRTWVKKYSRNGASELVSMSGKKSGFNKGRPRIRKMSVDDELIKLKAENSYLKKLLSLERGNVKD